MDQFARTQLLLGKKAMEKLKNSRVAIFGVGGVGGYSVEALARSGVGAIDLIDDDKVCLTNINRQIIATHDTIGESKVAVCESRIKILNPDCEVRGHQMFYLPDAAEHFDFTEYDYVVDAVDTVSAKLDIIERCKSVGVPIISCMGCGNRIDPTKLAIMDITKTSMDPLAKVIRKGLKDRRIKGVKVLCSTEEPIVPILPEGGEAEGKGTAGRVAPGSTPFVPAAAGLVIASEVVKDLTGFDSRKRTKGGR